MKVLRNERSRTGQSPPFFLVTENSRLKCTVSGITVRSPVTIPLSTHCSTRGKSVKLFDKLVTTGTGGLSLLLIGGADNHLIFRPLMAKSTATWSILRMMPPFPSGRGNFMDSHLSLMERLGSIGQGLRREKIPNSGGSGSDSRAGGRKAHFRGG